MLIKTLPRIAARILHNTHVGPNRLKEKYVLIAEAYGESAVERDFEKWCAEMADKCVNPRYPLSEYIKVVDERLGGEFVEPSHTQFDISDPQITPLSSTAFELTGYLPSRKIVSMLLVTYSSEEILAALSDYVSTLDERELKPGAKQFFTEGGAAAVILARRRRRGEAQ